MKWIEKKTAHTHTHRTEIITKNVRKVRDILKLNHVHAIWAMPYSRPDISYDSQHNLLSNWKQKQKTNESFWRTVFVSNWITKRAERRTFKMTISYACHCWSKYFTASFKFFFFFIFGEIMKIWRICTCRKCVFVQLDLSQEISLCACKTTDFISFLLSNIRRISVLFQPCATKAVFFSFDIQKVWNQMNVYHTYIWPTLCMFALSFDETKCSCLYKKNRTQWMPTNTMEEITLGHTFDSHSKHEIRLFTVF